MATSCVKCGSWCFNMRLGVLVSALWRVEQVRAWEGGKRGGSG